MSTDLSNELDTTTRHAISELVQQHCRTFPWYAELMRQRGLSADSPLELLPIVDEQMLIKEYYTAQRPDLVDASGYMTSGTASGLRKRIMYSPDDHERYIAHRRELFETFLVDVPQGSVAVADLGTGHAAASAQRIFREMGYAAHDIDFTRPIAEHVERLNEWQPDVFFTMPMILERLMRSDSLRISPKKIMVVGDVAPENWRRNVAERFGIGFEDVLDIFGSIETGAIAYYCAQTGLYHFHDHIVPEVVQPKVIYQDCDQDLEVGDTTSGILLLTSLARQYFPALRFATNDVVTGLRRIDWEGRPQYVFERIEGRFGGEIKHGERISHHDLVTAINQVFPGVAFDVVNDQKLEIRVVVDEVAPEQAAALRGHLLAASPDVAQMIESGLVADITVTSIRADELSYGRGKRSFTLTGA